MYTVKPPHEQCGGDVFGNGLFLRRPGDAAEGHKALGAGGAGHVAGAVAQRFAGNEGEGHGLLGVGGKAQVLLRQHGLFGEKGADIVHQRAVVRAAAARHDACRHYQKYLFCICYVFCNKRK